MSFGYYFGDIRIGLEHVEAVRDILRAQKITLFFGIEPQFDGSMDAYLVRSVLSTTLGPAPHVDGMLQDVARVIAGTEYDGQVISYVRGSESGVHVLAGGTFQTFTVQSLLLNTKEQEAVGKHVTLNGVGVIALPCKKALVVPGVLAR